MFAGLGLSVGKELAISGNKLAVTVLRIQLKANKF